MHEPPASDRRENAERPAEATGEKPRRGASERERSD
jgi:hypothetical protein